MPISQVPFAGISNPVDFRNIVINGDMQIAQRATSVASITTSSYNTVDRFRTAVDSLGTWTNSQSTDVPTGYGFANSFKLDCTTADASPAAGDLLFITQRFEGQNLQYLKKGTANALPLTASFWVKSTKTGTFICELQDVDNTRQISKSYTVSVTNTWEFKTVTFAGDTTGALDNNNENSLQLNFWLGAGTTYTSGALNTSWASTTNANRAVGQVNIADNTANDFLITGVQLEAGEQASGFEFMPIDTNLTRCLRYFYQIQGNASASTTLGIGFSNGPTEMYTYLKLPTTMRSVPSITGSSGIQASDFNAYTINYTSVAVSGTNQNQINLLVTVASGLTTLRPGGSTLTNSTASFIAFSSEL
jgi:hypothetical protein